METVSVPSNILCLISGVANGDICFLDRKRLEPKELLWQHHMRVLFCFFCDAHLWCQVSSSRTLLYISRDIVYSAFYNF